MSGSHDIPRVPRDRGAGVECEEQPAPVLARERLDEQLSGAGVVRSVMNHEVLLSKQKTPQVTSPKKNMFEYV